MVYLYVPMVYDPFSLSPKTSFDKARASGALSLSLKGKKAQASVGLKNELNPLVGAIAWASGFSEERVQERYKEKEHILRSQKRGGRDL